jgi:hypothetical protein
MHELDRETEIFNWAVRQGLDVCHVIFDLSRGPVGMFVAKLPSDNEARPPELFAVCAMQLADCNFGNGNLGAELDRMVFCDECGGLLKFGPLLPLSYSIQVGYGLGLYIGPPTIRIFHCSDACSTEAHTRQKRLFTADQVHRLGRELERLGMIRP